ncbi:hypothetical protein B0H13DRAFT_1884869 [Mycena leptocephala]|nr:hypothetical protein B0H13DRAFT_1884869 [Mycena leptocephala]
MPPALPINGLFAQHFRVIDRRPSPNHLCLPINYAWDRRVSAQILSSFSLLARRKWSQPELLGATGLLRGATGAHARALSDDGTWLRGYHKGDLPTGLPRVFTLPSTM